MNQLSGTKYQKIKNHINTLLEGLGLKSGEYPGGQPIHINQEDISDLLKKDSLGKYRYSMTLKEDGVRYILFSGPLVSKPGRVGNADTRAGPKDRRYRRPYFVNRIFEIFELDDPEIMFESRSSFILDGEIITYKTIKGDKPDKRKLKASFNLANKQIKHITFSVFDAMMLNGKSILNTNFDYRIKAAADLISFSRKSTPKNKKKLLPSGTSVISTRKFRTDKKGNKIIDTDTVPILQTKYNEENFSGFDIVVPTPTSIAELKKSIGDPYKWLIKHTKQLSKYKVPYDGIIFVPNMPYVIGAWKQCKNIQYKWKPTEEATIDVVYTKNKKGKVSFKSKGGFSVDDLLTKVTGDIPVGLESGSVIEIMYFRNTTKAWEFKQVRSDKQQKNANSRIVIQRVMNEPLELSVLRDFMVNPKDDKIRNRLMNYLSREKIWSSILYVKGVINKNTINKFIKMTQNKNTFIKINFSKISNKKYELSRECLRMEFPSYQFNILVLRDGSEQMLTGNDINNLIIRYKHKIVVKNSLNINQANVEVQEVQLDELKTSSTYSNSSNPEKTIGRTVIETPFGEVTFEETTDSDNKKSRKVYSELKQNKGPHGLVFINEFSRYLREIGEEQKFRALKK